MTGSLVGPPQGHMRLTWSLTFGALLFINGMDVIVVVSKKLKPRNFNF